MSTQGRTVPILAFRTRNMRLSSADVRQRIAVVDLDIRPISYSLHSESLVAGGVVGTLF